VPIESEGKVWVPGEAVRALWGGLGSTVWVWPGVGRCSRGC